MKNIANKLLLSLTLTASVSLTVSGQNPVKAVNSISAPQGLEGKNIALWGSHGLYYNETGNKWTWMRPHLFETVEDLFTSSYIIDLIAPMLENAGAYVMMPRERDTSVHEVIVDMDDERTPGYEERNGRFAWEQDSVAYGFGYIDYLFPDDNPFKDGWVQTVPGVTKASEASTASWYANIPERDTYTVYVSYASFPNSAKKVKYTVNSLRGKEEFFVDQSVGGGTWMRLGEFPLDAGESKLPVVSVTNLVDDEEGDCLISADAVKIGGGMGNVYGNKNLKKTSKYPRWAEAARYWLQWAGMDPSIFKTSSKGEKNPQYRDDIYARPLWVNYLTGGSKSNPNAEGLGIPIDVVVALHSDAGIRNDDSSVGTLGIYTTSENGGHLADGRSRSLCGELTNGIVNQIVGDMRKLHSNTWSGRNTMDKGYIESRVPKVPSALIEMLSHQNFGDMIYGLDPQFKFDLSRSIYKGIGRFLMKKDFIVQPLPVNSFSIKSNGNGNYTLTWHPTTDILEKTANPESYIVERKIGDTAFSYYKTTTTPQLDYTANENEITSFRIIAANKGGVSFPSEELSLCYKNNGMPEVLVVNGFTRISPADSYTESTDAGFMHGIDYGVPYKRNIAFSGEQIIFTRNQKFVDTSNPGYAGCKSTYDGYPVGGNTFDYPFVHGVAIANAGYPFVSTSIDAYTENPDNFRQPVVDLILGAQKETRLGVNSGRKTKFKIFTPELKNVLTKFIENGGKVMLSGAYIASDIYNNQFSDDNTLESDIDFATEVLNLGRSEKKYSTGGKINLIGSADGSSSGSTATYANKVEKNHYAIAMTDAIEPIVDKNVTIVARYRDNNATAGYFTENGKSKIALFGFPFESIKENELRNKLMNYTLHYLCPDAVNKSKSANVSQPTNDKNDDKKKNNKDKNKDKHKK